jgi:hypothetical protein
MFRSLIGFAVFAVIALVAIKLFLVLFGVAVGLAMTLLVWAAFGLLIYTGLRLVSPGTAEKVRHLITGRPADT